jgi:glycosyltransferase involved in cell wall biosynthesis
MWLDLYGDPLTIVQVARHRTGTDQGIGTAIALLQQVLKRGDAFSVCGIPQQHMLVGELAMSGRLNSRTMGYDFVHVVYPGAPPIPAETDPADIRQSIGIDPDAFVVLWCGGYNTWTDVTTLFNALEQAMEHNPRVHFVSVGASTYTATETQYDRLVQSVAQSRLAERFHLLGWRPWKDIPGFYRGSDVGINIDAMHYETVYGTRTRLMEMLAYNLPVITTEGCELSYLLQHKQVGLGFPVGEVAALAQHILRLANVPAELEEMRQSAKRVVVEDLSFQTTTAALRQWVAAPKPAPDREVARSKQYLRNTKFRMRTMARLFLWQLGLSGRRP